MSGFTPGPWIAAYTTLPAGPYDSVCDAQGRRICGIIAIGSAEEPDKYCGPTTVANAALIASAPELYEALRGIVAMAEDLAATFPIKATDEGLSVIDAARAALAKAVPPQET